jgi:hypothetical protein
MSKNPPACAGTERAPRVCWKVAYRTEGEARWHAQRSTREQFRPYRCQVCGLFHLASRGNTSRRNRYHAFVIRPTEDTP